MNCSECRELLAAYVEGLLDSQEKQLVETHLQECPACKAEADDFAKLHTSLMFGRKKFEYKDFESNVSDKILKEQTLRLRKITMFKKYAKTGLGFATAAAVIVAVGLLITVSDKVTTAAYALEETIQANHTVRFIHVRVSVPAHQEPKEFWTEFGAHGDVQRLRGEIPAWDDQYSEDGAKSFVWENDKAQIWLPKKKVCLTIKNKSIAAEILLLFTQLDPKLTVERLNEKASNSKVKTEVVEPSNVSEPITITATSLPNESLNEEYLQKVAAAKKANADERSVDATSVDPNMLCHRMVLYIDQATKLVTSIDLFRLKDGTYEKTAAIEYLDYNQPIAASVFALTIPADAMVIDQTSQEVGLLQGNLTEQEIAVEVVRQFMEAMIARDYTKASPLYEGIPAETLAKEFSPLKILKIVSIGEPVPSTMTGGYKVPCVLEIEKKNGKIKQWSPNGPFVRQVHGQPGRWTICGGI